MRDDLAFSRVGCIELIGDGEHDFQPYGPLSLKLEIQNKQLALLPSEDFSGADDPEGLVARLVFHDADAVDEFIGMLEHLRRRLNG